MNEKTLRVLLVEDNAVSAQVTRTMLLRAERSVFDVQITGTLMGALDHLGPGGFDVVLLDLGLPDSDGLGTLTTIRGHAPQVPVLVLTSSDNEALANSALQYGAQDYLVKGQFDGHGLARALRYAVTRHRQATDHSGDEARIPQAKVIGIVGAKGGVGGSTIATHLSLEIRRVTGSEVLLTDLDLNGGSVGFLMKVAVPHTLLDVSLNLHRLDAALWHSLVWKHASGVDVLQSPGSAHLGEQLREDRVRHLLHFAGTQYSWIVIDMGRFNELSINLVRELNELLLITTAEVPALYEAKRIVQKLTELCVAPGNIRVIVNRAARSDIDVPELEKTFGMPIHAFCPEARRDLHEAYSEGELLPASTSLRKQIAQIAKGLTGEASEKAKSTGRSFFGLLRGA